MFLLCLTDGLIALNHLSIPSHSRLEIKWTNLHEKSLWQEQQISRACDLRAFWNRTFECAYREHFGDYITTKKAPSKIKIYSCWYESSETSALLMLNLLKCLFKKNLQLSVFCAIFIFFLLPLKMLNTLRCVFTVNIMTLKHTEVYSIHRYALMASNCKDHSAAFWVTGQKSPDQHFRLKLWPAE